MKRRQSTPAATRAVLGLVSEAESAVAAPCPLTVACVLRSGGLYDARWVRALRVQVERHLPWAHRFVCLSDLHVGDAEAVPLLHDWPGWWSKIELFRPGLFDGPVLYLDLDTLAVGDLSELGAWRGDFAILRDFYRPEGLGSGVMAWTPGDRTAGIHDRFAADPQGIVATCRGGDQEFIETVLGTGPDVDRIQDLFPGQVVSYKAHHCHTQTPEGARLVAFHGRPKPTDCGGWAQAAWEAAVRGEA